MTNRYLIHQGDVLRAERRSHGLTMREVSEWAGIALGYLSEIERADKSPHPDVIADLCRVYRLRHSDLLRRIADSMDLFDQDVLHWSDEHSTTVPGVRAGSLPRP